MAVMLLEPAAQGGAQPDGQAGLNMGCGSLDLTDTKMLLRDDDDEGRRTQRATE